MTKSQQKKVNKLKDISKSLGLIDSKTFREKYYGGKEKRQISKYHFDKYEKIILSGTSFIIDPKKL